MKTTYIQPQTECILLSATNIMVSLSANGGGPAGFGDGDGGDAL